MHALRAGSRHPSRGARKRMARVYARVIRPAQFVIPAAVDRCSFLRLFVRSERAAVLDSYLIVREERRYGRGEIFL